MKKLVIEASMQQFLPHLQVVTVDATGIVFSRTNNVGYIENGILFTRPEYLPGGAKNTVFFDQDFKVLSDTLKLKEVTTEEAYKTKNEIITRVLSIAATIKATPDLEQAERLALEAANIGEKINDQRVITALNEIAVALKEKQDKAATEKVEEEKEPEEEKQPEEEKEPEEEEEKKTTTKGKKGKGKKKLGKKKKAAKKKK